MKKYKPAEVSEKQLEDLIRQAADHIEEGLKFIDHQRRTERGPLDILFVDSGNALAVAELKIVEDDTMLVQGIDYYDFVSKNIEGMARIYKEFKIDPTQPIRLLLIAPSFSNSIVNRCKWIDIPISLFTYKSITFEDSKDIVLIFSEIETPSAPKAIENYNLGDRLKYITDATVRTIAQDLLNEIQNWNKDKILIEPTKHDISLRFLAECFLISRREENTSLFIHTTEKNSGRTMLFISQTIWTKLKNF